MIMETNVTHQKLEKCAACPYYDRCPDSVRLSPLCARQKKAATWYYMGEEAYKRLETAHKN